MKTISAVIPTFHRYEPLEDTVRDLFRQTVPPKQIIVVDNTMLAEREAPAYLVSNEQTECIYISSRCEAQVNVARNEGLKAVTADYAVLFDDDMSLPPGCLESFLQVHAEGWDAVTGVLHEEGVLLETPERRSRRPLWEVLRSKHGEFTGHTIAVPEGLISMRMEMLERLGYLDEAFLYNYDDYDLGYRIWRGGYTLIHDGRVTAHHLKLPQGGSRRDLIGNKRRLNKYTAKYYFLLKHFGDTAVRIEFLTDIMLTVWDNRWTLGRMASELALQVRALRGYCKYGVETTDDQTVNNARPRKVSIVSSADVRSES